MFRTASPVNTDGTIAWIPPMVSARKSPKFRSDRPDIMNARVLPRKMSQEEAIHRLRMA